MFKSLFASSALLALAIAAPASAEPGVEWRGLRGDFAVSARGLDLANPQDQATLYHRVERASQRLCRHVHPRADREECIRRSVDMAVQGSSPRMQEALRNARNSALAAR